MDSAFLAALRTAERILIATHERPDGDAIGSLCAALGILRDNGFQAYGILPSPVPDFYASFLPEEGIVASGEGIAADVFLVVDCSNSKRIAAAGYPIDNCPTVINVDHHPDNEHFGTLTLLNPSAAATAQELYSLFRKAGFHISAENATRLLLGLITDSGCVRFDNTDAAALRAAADLLDLGADHHRIILSAFSSRPENLVRLEAELGSKHLKTALGGRFAWIVLDPEVLNRFGVEVRNTESLIEIPRNIAGVEFAAVLRPENGGYKLSLRAKNAPYSAGRIARRLNGGGHEMAAGGFIPAKRADEAEKILLQQVEMELKEHEKQSR